MKNAAISKEVLKLFNIIRITKATNRQNKAKKVAKKFYLLDFCETEIKNF